MPKPEVVHTDGVTVVTFGQGTVLDESAMAELKCIQHSVEEREPPRMVIDLESISIIDSAFRTFLQELNQGLRFQIGGKLGICHASARCRDMLSRSTHALPLEVFETREAAVEAYTEGIDHSANRRKPN